MSITEYLVALLTTAITFTSLLLILYIFIRERQYAYQDEEGVYNEAYENLSKKTACGTKITFLSSIMVVLALVLTDPLHVTTEISNATIPATLAGIGLGLFLISVIIIFKAFWELTQEELS